MFLILVEGLSPELVGRWRHQLPTLRALGAHGGPFRAPEVPYEPPELVTMLTGAPCTLPASRTVPDPFAPRMYRQHGCGTELRQTCGCCA